MNIEENNRIRISEDDNDMEDGDTNNWSDIKP